MDVRAYKIRTVEGSDYIALFEPKCWEKGILWGRIALEGYSQVAEQKLRIVGMSSEPEVEGHITIHGSPWSVEVVEGEEVPLFEYETISVVEDITDKLESVISDQDKEAEQEVEPRS